MRPSFRALAGVLLLALAAGAIADGEASAPAELVTEGRALYLEGRHADGRPLQAARAGGLVVSGAQAACASCHRRSGMGGAEGRSYIPPIVAAALSAAMPQGRGPSARGEGRPAYDGGSLARALREGVDAAGRKLDYLMPRYRLAEREVQALHAYLRTLPEAPVAPSGPVHFATVLAPGVAAGQGEAMLGVLQACLAEHNAGPLPERGRRKLATPIAKGQGRAWELHEWRLQGAPGTWAEQLAEHARAQPVFALVGGSGGAEWAPVHDFCERAGLPCLFPHVESPPAAAGVYSLYLNGGTLLEAGLVARQVARDATRVVQVLRDDDPAAEAAAAALRARSIGVVDLRIPAGDPIRPGTLAAVQPEDALVLWLRPPDLLQLAGVAPVAAQVFVSATLARRDEIPLPSDWQARTRVAYPFELPQQRAARVATMRRWLDAHGLALVDERVQADAFIACKALGTAMAEAGDHLARDYLVERVEGGIARTTVTGLYPSLGLGIDQRIASKTGYLVRFSEEGLAAVGERIAP